MSLGDAGLVDQLATDIVGRRREIEVVAAALRSGRHVLVEGPPGTGKSTLLSSLARRAGVEMVFVEGNAELTPARLIGHHDPSRVMSEGYTEDVFVDGPLLRAMRGGGLLYIEEINRIAEETLNVLVGVMSEGAIEVARVGRVEAADGFRIVAAMNPYDSVGTARISSSIYDRCCKVLMDYQSAEEESEIVVRSVHSVRSVPRPSRPGASAGPDALGDAGWVDWVAAIVRLVRRTRNENDIRVGSSVRGAIDMALVGDDLARIRRVDRWRRDVSLDAALAALSGRIRLHEGSKRSAEEVVEALWSEVFSDRSRDDEGPPESTPWGKEGAPQAAGAAGTG